MFWKVASLELLGNTLDVLEIQFWERPKAKSFRDDITQAHISHHALQCSSHAAILSQSFRQHHVTNRSELDDDRKVESQETKVQPEAAGVSSLKGTVHRNWNFLASSQADVRAIS